MALKPVFMMHSILEDLTWDYDFLVTLKDELLLVIRFLKQLGFRFIRATEWANANDRSVCLTFDDGFLDNWTLLFPLLEAEGVPFTIFVCRDFVEDSEEIRPFGLKKAGYLSRGEIRELHASGLVDIQSHTTTHTWYPTELKVVEIFQPNKKNRYPWMLWNNDTARKPTWMSEDYSAYQGLPVLVNDRSLRARRLLLDEERWLRFQETVQKGGLNVEEANRLLKEIPALGRLESTEESSERYRLELLDNASFIREMLGYETKVLCWPGGAYNELSLNIAKEEGYIHTQNKGFGRDPLCMHRLSPVNPYGRERFPWKYQKLTLTYYLLRFCFGYYRLPGRTRSGQALQHCK